MTETRSHAHRKPASSPGTSRLYHNQGGGVFADTTASAFPGGILNGVFFSAIAWVSTNGDRNSYAYGARHLFRSSVVLTQAMALKNTPLRIPPGKALAVVSQKHRRPGYDIGGWCPASWRVCGEHEIEFSVIVVVAPCNRALGDVWQYAARKRRRCDVSEDTATQIAVKPANRAR